MVSSIRSDVDQQLASLQAELCMSERTVQQLKEAARKAESEADLYRRSLELEKSSAKDTQRAMNSLKQTLNEGCKEMEILDEKSQGMHAQLKSRDQQLKVLQTELHKMKEDYKNATSSCKSLRFEVQMTKKDLEENTTQLLAAHKHIQEMEAGTLHAGGQLSTIQRVLDERKQQLQEQLSEKKCLVDEVKSLKVRLQQAEQETAKREHLAMERRKTTEEERVATSSRLKEVENELTSTQMLKTQSVKELSTRLAESQARNRHLQLVCNQIS